jgi:hypothetical protein
MSGKGVGFQQQARVIVQGEVPSTSTVVGGVLVMRAQVASDVLEG